MDVFLDIIKGLIGLATAIVVFKGAANKMRSEGGSNISSEDGNPQEEKKRSLSKFEKFYALFWLFLLPTLISYVVFVALIEGKEMATKGDVFLGVFILMAWIMGINDHDR